MTRDELLTYIEKKYGAKPEYLWKKYPNYAVFRQPHNRKWFAIIMDAEAHNLGLTGNEVRDVLDLKLESGLIEILRPTTGYLPAYHMNKQHWLSLLIDELATAQIKDLLDMSYHLTK